MDPRFTTLISLFLLCFNQRLSKVSSATIASVPNMIPPFDFLNSSQDEDGKPCHITKSLNGKEQTFFCPSLQQIDVQVTLEIEQEVKLVCISRDINVTDIDINVGEVFAFESSKCNLVGRLRRVFDQWNVINAEKWKVPNFSDKDFVLQRMEFDGMDVSSVKTIWMDNSNIIAIEDDVFRDFINLEIVDLKSNKIRNFPDFTNSRSLRVIDFGSNELESLPDRLDLPVLRSLLLWTNNITEINESFFANATQVEVLELRANQIGNLPEKLLVPLSKLSEIGLSENSFAEVPGNFFEMNKNLETISLGSRDLAVIPENIFAGLSKLNTIRLQATLLETLPEKLFIDRVNLANLSLDENRLKYLPKRVFQNLKNLKNLNLSNNLLSKWKVYSKTLRNLKGLDLSGNKFVNIDADFSDLSALKSLSFKRNNISYIANSAFEDLELDILDLSYNNLSESDGFIYSMARADKIILAYNKYETVLSGFEAKTKILDMSHNKIKNLTLVDVVSLEKGIFNNNEIDTIDFNFMNEYLISIANESHRDTNLTIDNNPINCGCDSYDLLQYYDGTYKNQAIYGIISISKQVKCEAPPKLGGISVTSLKSASFSCDYSPFYRCPDECSCEMYPKYGSLNVSCAHRNLTSLPVIPPFQIWSYGDPITMFTINKLIIDLRNNSIVNFTRDDYSYVNASELYLSDNKLATINWLPLRLKILQLNNNRLENLGYDAILALNNSDYLTQLTLHDNQWKCNCKLLNFTRMIKVKNLKIPFAERILCSDGERVVKLVEGNLCGFENQAALIAIGSCFFLLMVLIGIALILYYKYEYHVRVWLYSKPIFMRFVAEEELDKDKIYDAFLSYSPKDEEFVVKEIVSELEGGPNKYKICIPVRDFIVGDFISGQIADSVEKSRRTIIVLTSEFLKSEWQMTEFKTAHNLAMRDGRHQLIVILHGNIDPKTIDDTDLRTYISTNTYVKWEDPWFWKKVRYVLRHKSERNNNDVNKSKKKVKNTKRENVMVAIDKMDLINSPATPNVATLPAISLDPLLVKGNGLR